MTDMPITNIENCESTECRCEGGADRELLELAAKAAGYDHLSWIPGGFRVPGEKEWWNPLADDGDALRLAVRLGIERIFVLRLGPNGVCVDGSKEPETVPVFEHPLYRVVFDQYAATRRAIVRAAAAIARATTVPNEAKP